MANGAEIAGMVAAELAKAFLMAYFINLRNSGLTPEQQTALYAEVRTKFEASDPSQIPDV